MRNSISELTKPYTIRMDRILLDSFNLPTEPNDHNRELPARISDQCLQLPEDLQQNIRVAYKERVVALSLPLPLKKGTVFVAYNDNPPYRVKAVYFSKNGKAGKPIDVGKEALCFGPYTELTRIYKRVACLAEDGGSTNQPDKPRGTDEKVKEQGSPSKGQQVVGDREESKPGGDEEVL